MPDLTITIHGEWVAAYLAIGALLWLPLEAKVWRSVSPRNRSPFWRELWRGIKRRPFTPVVVLAAWPYAVYEAYS